MYQIDRKSKNQSTQKKTDKKFKKKFNHGKHFASTGQGPVFTNIKKRTYNSDQQEWKKRDIVQNYDSDEEDVNFEDLDENEIQQLIEKRKQMRNDYLQSLIRLSAITFQTQKEHEWYFENDTMENFDFDLSDLNGTISESESESEQDLDEEIEWISIVQNDTIESSRTNETYETYNTKSISINENINLEKNKLNTLTDNINKLSFSEFKTNLKKKLDTIYIQEIVPHWLSYNAHPNSIDIIYNEILNERKNKFDSTIYNNETNWPNFILTLQSKLKISDNNLYNIASNYFLYYIEKSNEKLDTVFKLIEKDFNETKKAIPKEISDSFEISNYEFFPWEEYKRKLNLNQNISNQDIENCYILHRDQYIPYEQSILNLSKMKNQSLDLEKNNDYLIQDFSKLNIYQKNNSKNLISNDSTQNKDIDEIDELLNISVPQKDDLKINNITNQKNLKPVQVDDIDDFLDNL